MYVEKLDCQIAELVVRQMIKSQLLKQLKLINCTYLPSKSCISSLKDKILIKHRIIFFENLLNYFFVLFIVYFSICVSILVRMFSTKRKSQEARGVQQFARRSKRYRTFTRERLNNNCKDQHVYVQSVVTDALYEIVDSAYDIIWKKNKEKVLQKVAIDCIVIGDSALSVSLINPSDQKSCMKNDIQPNSIQCDNLCGVDQVCNKNNQKISKIDKTTIYNLRPLNKHHYANQQRIKSTGNLSNVHRRKQTTESHEVSFSSTINAEKSTPLSNNQFHLKDRSNSSHRLIPLFKQRDQESSEAKIQQFMRDKLLKAISNKKMSIKLKQMNQISSLSMAAKTIDLFNFDYNGDKINLIKESGNKAVNNILKTTYKLNKDKNEIKQHQIRASINFRPSFTNDGSYFPLKEKLINGLKISNQSQDAFNIKSRLESEFKKQKINYRMLNVE